MNPGKNPNSAPTNNLESSRGVQNEQTESITQLEKKIAAMQKVADSADPALKATITADIAKIKTPLLMKALAFTTDVNEQNKIKAEMAILATGQPQLRPVDKNISTTNNTKKGNNQPNPFKFDNRDPKATMGNSDFTKWEDNAL